MIQDAAVNGGNLYISVPHLTIAFGRVDTSLMCCKFFLNGNLQLTRLKVYRIDIAIVLTMHWICYYLDDLICDPLCCDYQKVS